MSLLYSAARVLLKPKALAFEKAARDPLGAQKKVLFEYLARNKNTEYGSKYKFSEIRSIADYQRAVPFSDCETMRPYLVRMTNGEENILTKDKPIFFGATSGTTNLPKYVPTTGYSDSKKTELMDIWSYYILRDHPKVLGGKILAVVSPEWEGYTGSGLSYGAESGHAYKNLPGMIKHFYAIPYAVFDISDYDARYYTILRISMEHNITTVATLNPNSILLLCRNIKKWQDTIIDDIEKGALNADLAIPQDIRKAIEKRLRPNPGRARELKDIIRNKKRLLPKDFWPDMELIECWKGGAMALYLKEIALYFGDVPVRDIGCVSTEARSSITMSDEGASGVLAIKTNFYEFIPKEDIGKKEKRVALCDQLEKGKDYFLILTTAGGLYRYNIDDVVRVTGTFNNTPMIEFVQKGLDATSLAGEKLYESQLNEAMTRVLSKEKLFIEFFCAVAQREDWPRYIFLVEFSEGTPLPADKKVFLQSLEEELYRQNREYEFVRKARLLAPPILKVVSKGEFGKYRAKRVAEGAHDTQFKIRELISDPSFQWNFHIEEEVHI